MHACCTVGRKVCLRLHLLVGVWYNVNRPYAVQYYSVVVSQNHKIKIALDAGMAVTKIAICSSAAITTNCTCTVHYKIASAVTKSRNHELKFALDVDGRYKNQFQPKMYRPLRNYLATWNIAEKSKMHGKVENARYSRKCTIKSKMHDKVENTRKSRANTRKIF